MKFTLGWLKEHLETEATLEELVNSLTMIGLEVEEVIDRSEHLEPFIVGHVIDVVPHAVRLLVDNADPHPDH